MEQAISWGHYTREVMVLHNDKWKYKAKRNYERKHAIKSANKNSTKERTGDGSADNDGGSDGGSYNEGFGSDSSLASGDEDAGSDGGLKRRSKKNAKSSNSWRFEDPIVDETILKDPEYIARLEAIKAEEENRAAYMRNLVNDKLKNHEEAGEVDLDNKYSILKEIKSMKKFKQTDIQNWRFDDNLSDSDDNGDAYEPEVRDFTPEEREKFLALQKRINHQKDVDKIRNRMDQLNNKTRPGKAKVLELHSKTGGDKYRAAVDKNLRNAHDKIDTQELDNLVQTMIGVNFTTHEKAEPHNTEHSKFDLDTMLQSTSGTAKSENVGKSTVASTGTIAAKRAPVVLETAELDDFLDSIL